MNQLIEDLQKLKSWKQLMRTSCKANQLKTIHANQLTLLKLKSLNIRLSKSYQNLGEKVANIWIENELKTFNWLLIAISGLQNIPIAHFQQEHWQLLESIFLHKRRSFLKFEAQKLISSKLKNKQWTKQQNDLLLKIVKQSSDDNYPWNDIARKMFEDSEEQIFRTGKHCRERWLNYLDPSKERGEWTAEDDDYLLAKVHKSGKKWSQYAAHLNRTEHMVKNRYNSLLIKQKKATPQIKKQERLIEQLRKNIMNNPSYSHLPVSLAHESQAVSVKEEEKDGHFLPQQAEKHQVVDVNAEKATIKYTNQQLKDQVNIPQQDFKQDVQLLRYTKDQEEFKSVANFNQYGLFSPYWNYSPSNNTPNNFMNSPSPVSFYINPGFPSNFNKFYHNWLTSYTTTAQTQEKP